MPASAESRRSISHSAKKLVVGDGSCPWNFLRAESVCDRRRDQRGEKREHRSNLATTQEVGADSDKYTDCDEEGERRPAMFEERVDGVGCPDGRTDCEFGGVRVEGKVEYWEDAGPL